MKRDKRTGFNKETAEFWFYVRVMRNKSDDLQVVCSKQTKPAFFDAVSCLLSHFTINRVSRSEFRALFFCPLILCHSFLFVSLVTACRNLAVNENEHSSFVIIQLGDSQFQTDAQKDDNFTFNHNNFFRMCALLLFPSRFFLFSPLFSFHVSLAASSYQHRLVKFISLYWLRQCFDLLR